MAKQTLTAFGNKVKQWEKRYPNAVYEGVKQAAEIVEKAARANAGTALRPRTGNLQRSIKAIVSRKPVQGIIRINKKADYPKGIHERGGTITAKKSDYLVFKVGDQWVKKKSVHMPARPFLAPALESNRKNVSKIIGMIIRRAVFDVRQ